MSILDAFRIDNKIALITGCRRGIGKAIAQALAEAGADIIGVSIGLEKKHSEVEKDVQERGKHFYGYSCDFADRRTLYDFIQQVKSKHPVIDILVNNAGVTLRKPAVEHPDEYWDQVVQVNQTAPFILSREIGKDMLARGYGKIIFIASLMTFQGGITIPGYTASKGAIGQLTKALANEWAGSGVNVNAIAPGYIDTDLNSALKKDKIRFKSILDRIPAGRWGEPSDLQGAVVFLSSGASDYVHGTILTVDGGWMGR